MKALGEIGFRKAARYALGEILMLFFKLMVVSPLRVVFLKMLGVRIGREAIIHDCRFFNLYRTGFKGLKIGGHCFIGNDCLFDLADKIIIKNYVTFAERVNVLTHTNVGYKDHPLQKFFPSSVKAVVFEHGCFIGTNATILPGVTIGECAVIGAGAVVTKDVEPYTVVVGVPAKVIKNLKSDDDV